MASSNGFLEEEALDLALMNGSHHPETFIRVSRGYSNSKLCY